MNVLITILVILVCILLILVILIQNPKGGLDSAFSTNTQVGGVKQTANFLEDSTWTLGIVIVCLSIFSSFFNVSSNASLEEETSKIQDKALETVYEPKGSLPENILNRSSNVQATSPVNKGQKELSKPTESKKNKK